MESKKPKVSLKGNKIIGVVRLRAWARGRGSLARETPPGASKSGQLAQERSAAATASSSRCPLSIYDWLRARLDSPLLLSALPSASRLRLSGSARRHPARAKVRSSITKPVYPAGTCARSEGNALMSFPRSSASLPRVVIKEGCRRVAVGTERGLVNPPPRAPRPQVVALLSYKHGTAVKRPPKVPSGTPASATFARPTRGQRGRTSRPATPARALR